VENKRDTLKHLMEKTVNDQARYGNWHYAAVRPQRIPSSYRSGDRVYVDCSDGVRMLARLAGIGDDPAGNGYSDYGNSSSIWAHLDHIPKSEAQTGDLVTFGNYAGEHHVAMLYENGKVSDPLVWNMGTQGQPVLTRLSNEIRYHGGQRVTFCRINVPRKPQTPQERLRARKGYWNWMQWKLGEGHWKKYKPADKRVRPDVPAMPPWRWWRDYGRFLAARKKANPNKKVK